MEQPSPVEPAELDLAQLAYLLGLRANETVLCALYRAGFVGLRPSHGFLFQHLLGGPCTMADLAARLDVSQQAVSKAVRELRSLGYVESQPAHGTRAQRILLTERGEAAVSKARALRAKADAQLAAQVGSGRLLRAKQVLATALRVQGGTQAVRLRRVRMPRG